MNATNILARFLSLMDIALLLLGIFIVLLSIARYTKAAAEKETVVPSVQNMQVVLNKAANENMSLIFLYAGSTGKRKGHCYTLEDGFIPGREIDTATDSDLRQLIKERNAINPIIFLVSEKGAWDIDWPEKRIRAIEKTWQEKVIRVVNVPFEKEKEKEKEAAN